MYKYNVRVVDNADGACVLLSDDECGGWASSFYDENTGDDVSVDLTMIIAKHLVKNEICILMTVSADWMRYLTGNAIAFNHTGDIVQVSLDDIYEKAKRKFKAIPTRAEY